MTTQDAVSPSSEDLPGSDLVWTKLSPPRARPVLVRRANLESLLQAGVHGKLSLLAAPAGFGKTTLLLQWRAAVDAGVAWVSLDEGDNDPTRFWTYVVEALRTVEPTVGASTLEALRRASADFYRVILPSLINELHAIDSQVFLVLDDLYLVTSPTCHQTLTFFLEHLPVNVHVVVSTRADPPLPLARMRAGGELAEIRVADLRFTSEEASALLNASMRLGLSAGDLERLVERTEGWAAGLYLAGLSLHGRADPDTFIASFQGDNRHVADYLGAEVLARQPDGVRTFLLRTSILERLSGSLCDAVLEAEGSADVLRELERSNQFLLSLDDHRRWYRYHHLFAELLRVELGSREASVVPVLHRRAAAWHRDAGNVDEAIHHAAAAGDFAQAGALIARHWLAYWRRGRKATVSRWLDALPDKEIAADPAVAFVAGWIRGFGGASKQETERWFAVAEAGGDERPLPDGISSLAFGAAIGRASLLFDDVGRALAAAMRALELAGSRPSPFVWMAQSALGHALYLSGQPARARRGLQDLVDRVPASAQPYAVVTALAVLSLSAGDSDDAGPAVTLAHRALAIAEEQGLSAEPLCGVAYVALGRALARRGQLAEAEELLGRALELVWIDSMLAQRALALLLLASVRRDRGDLRGARVAARQARELIRRFADPGSLPTLLEWTERRLASTPRRVEAAAPLTDRELAVLRLLPTRLSAQQMSSQLYVSVNTVRTHIKALYRKLEATTRAEAVARARELDLLRETDGHLT